jgi:hypothetical protein
MAARVRHDTLSVMRTYTELFAIREFRVLFVTRCLAVASMSVASLALGTITYAETGSAVLTALSLFGGPLITLLGSATLLGASDMLRPRTALLLLAGASLVADALQAVPGLPWQLRFLILTIPYVVLSATAGAMLRLLSQIVGEHGFVLGRATLNVAVGTCQIVGFSAGGLLLVAFTARELFAVAAVVDLVLLVTIRLGIGDHPGARSGEGLVRRTRVVNRQLLGSPVTRPLYLCLWVPNGLIVGCEALFVPFTDHAGLLFAAMAAGMLAGDVGVGRFASQELRDRLLEPLRLLLAAPWLLLFLAPPLPVVLVIAFCSAIGYAASLPLQDRLLRVTGEQTRGQTFGLALNGMKIGHAGGALLGGLLATWVSTSTAMGLLAVASLAVTLAVTRGLRRSAPGRRQQEVSLVPVAQLT